MNEPAAAITVCCPLPLSTTARRRYQEPLSAASIAAAVCHRYHGPLSAAAIGYCCLLPLSQPAVCHRYRGLLSATAATGRQLMLGLNY